MEVVKYTFFFLTALTIDDAVCVAVYSDKLLILRC